VRPERQVRAVPRPVTALLLAGLVAQGAWHGAQPPPVARAEALPPPPAMAILRLASLGDEVLMAKLLMIWLQAFDDQPGISIPFRELDYAQVEAWLRAILSLDPRSQYPLLAASRLYGEVPDEARQRRMLEFVYEEFHQDPNRRWPWLAHAAILAKHRLRDLPLALKYARAITEEATGAGVPYWARDMSILILEDMGELESARVLAGGLLESGDIQDPHQLRFLQEKLRELAAQGVEISTGR
jgi:hypothetical protein